MYMNSYASLYGTTNINVSDLTISSNVITVDGFEYTFPSITDTIVTQTKTQPVSNKTITYSTINNTVIGAIAPSTGNFTTTNTVSLYINGVLVDLADIFRLSVNVTDDITQGTKLFTDLIEKAYWNAKQEQLTFTSPLSELSNVVSIDLSSYFNMTTNTTDNLTDTSSNRLVTDAQIASWNTGSGLWSLSVGTISTAYNAMVNGTLSSSGAGDFYGVLINGNSFVDFTRNIQCGSINGASCNITSGSYYCNSSEFINAGKQANLNQISINSSLLCDVSKNINCSTIAINSSSFVDISKNIYGLSLAINGTSTIDSSRNIYGYTLAINGTSTIDASRNIYANTVSTGGTQVIDASRNIYGSTLYIGGTQVIDGSRAIINVTAITTSGNITGQGLIINSILAFDLLNNMYCHEIKQIAGPSNTVLNVDTKTLYADAIYINGTQILNSSRNLSNIVNLTTSGTNLFNGLTYLYNTLYMNGNILVNTSKELFPSAITHDSNIVITSSNTTPMIRIGYSTSPNSSGINSCCIGNFSGYSLTTGNYNTCVGGHSGYTMSGANNCFIGSYAGYNASSTGESTYTGSECGYLNSGSSNTGAGFQSLGYGTGGGGNNCAYGHQSLRNNTTASGGCAFGKEALYNNTTGLVNCGYGYQALYSTSTGGYNTAMGYQAGYSITVGNNNVCIGRNSAGSYTGGECVQIGALTGNSSCGYGGIAVGYASNSVGYISTVVGYGSYCDASYASCIGYNVSSAADSQAYALYLNTNIPSASGTTLVITGNGRVGPTTSARRFKKDIVTLEDEKINALDVVMKMRSIVYTSINDIEQNREIGYIAEEIQPHLSNVVRCDNTGQCFSISYERIVPILSRAIQQQNVKITALENTINNMSIQHNKALEDKVALLEERFNNLLSLQNITYI